jgi:anti-sigma factor RsiW
VNDSRFIELLNLYLDHQLAPEEAAELESEVMRNPARRRTYDQYCRLQRGCCLLGERERSVAPSSQAFDRSLRDVERKISSPRRSTWQPAYAGFFAVSAMAACVAVIFIVNRSPSGGAGTSAPELTAKVVPEVSQPEVAEPVMVAATQPVSAPVAPRAIPFDIQPALAASGFGVARNAREAEIAAADPEALEWMKRVEKLPIQRIVIDDQTFETRATLHQDNRVFRSRQAMQGTAEFTAFQFQR